jgi:hypothetical protein
MKYFAFITHELSLKNNLEIAAKELLMGNNRTIIEEKDIDWFRNEITKSIEKLNAQYPRCTPLKPSWWQPGWANEKKRDWALNNIGSCTFNLYATRD